MDLTETLRLCRGGLQGVFCPLVLTSEDSASQAGPTPGSHLLLLLLCLLLPRLGPPLRPLGACLAFWVGR